MFTFFSGVLATLSGSATAAERSALIQEKFLEDMKIVLEEPEGPHWATIMNFWYGADSDRAQVLRLAQIFVSSMRIVYKSKNQDTAESRLKLAIKIWHRGMHDGDLPLNIQLSRLIPENLLKALEEDFVQHTFEMRWHLPINYAEGLVYKAGKLKTLKGRKKLLDLAMAHLDKAIQFSGVDMVRVQAVREEIKSLLDPNRIEIAITARGTR